MLAVWSARGSRACAIGLAALGCGGAPPRTAPSPVPSPVPAFASACAIGSPAAPSADSIVVALDGTVDATHVPSPVTAAERFVFAQAYETLVTVDCEGHARPALASSWTLDATKTRVTFTLRAGARLSGGEPVSAADVVAAWRATAAGVADSGQFVASLARGTTIVDEHTLIVSLPDTAWLALATPALAVYRAVPGGSWPEGTGEYRVAGTSRSTTTLVRTNDASGSRVMVRSMGEGGARDAIDAGADVVVTADPAALDYAARRPALVETPLPWDRTYALFVPGALPPALASLAGDSAAAIRRSLAHDAVRAEARGAEAPYWWAGISVCSLNNINVDIRGSANRAPRIAHGVDPVARALAERLVALGGAPAAAELPPTELARGLHDATESAFVIALPERSIAPCRDLTALLTAAPWLSPARDDWWRAIVPLVETRKQAIVRQDRVAATVDWDGTLRLLGRRQAP